MGNTTAPTTVDETEDTTTLTTDENTDGDDTPPEETLEEVSIPQALLNFKSKVEKIDPRTLAGDNIRPSNPQHILDIQAGIRESFGFDGEIIVMRQHTGWDGLKFDQPVNYIFDGHQRIGAIVGYVNKNLGINIVGLLDAEDTDPELRAVLNPLTVTVYKMEDVFPTRLEFLKAQFRVNSGRRNISENAADAAASVAQMLQEGATPAELKAIVKKSEGWISNAKVAHENCIDELKKAVREGLVSGKTLIEARNVDKKQQKAMLKEIIAETKNKTEKEAQKAERTIADKFIAETRTSGGGTPKFPTAVGRKDFSREAHSAYLDFESNCSSLSVQTKEFKVEDDPREQAIFYKGYIQGMLAAFHVKNAGRANMAVKSIEGHFKALTGLAIGDVDAINP